MSLKQQQPRSEKIQALEDSQEEVHFSTTTYPLHDLPYLHLLPPQDKSKVIKGALPASQSLHLQLPQLLLADLQQRLDEMRLPESDIQKDAVGLEDAVNLPSNESQKKK